MERKRASRVTPTKKSVVRWIVSWRHRRLTRSFPWQNLHSPSVFQPQPFSFGQRGKKVSLSVLHAHPNLSVDPQGHLRREK